jgi:hypothetical protein
LGRLTLGTLQTNTEETTMMTRTLKSVVLAAAFAALTLPAMAQSSSGTGAGAGGAGSPAGTAGGAVGGAAGAGGAAGTGGAVGGNNGSRVSPGADTTGTVNSPARESGNTKCQNAGGVASNMATPGQAGGNANCN